MTHGFHWMRTTTLLTLTCRCCQMTLRAYIGMLRMADTLYSNEYYIEVRRCTMQPMGSSSSRSQVK